MIHSNNIIGMHAVLYWRGSDDIVIIANANTDYYHGFYVHLSSGISRYVYTYINWVQVLECTVYYCTGGC